MTGDTYSAAALMALRSDVHVILLSDQKEAQDGTKRIRSFYTECNLQDRVTVVDAKHWDATSKDIWRAFNKLGENAGKPGVPAGYPPKKGATVEQALPYLYMNFGNKWPKSITWVTGTLAEEFKKAGAPEKVAKLWKSDSIADDLAQLLENYIKEKFAKIDPQGCRENILVVWSRQSGKHGGAHVELDSSFKGLCQIAMHYAESKATVMLAGDDKEPNEAQSRPNSRLNELAATSPQIVNVGEMWKEDFWKKHFAKKHSPRPIGSL